MNSFEKKMDRVFEEIKPIIVSSVKRAFAEITVAALNSILGEELEVAKEESKHSCAGKCVKDPEQLTMTYSDGCDFNASRYVIKND